MEEVIPVGSGFVLGLVLAYLGSARFRLGALAVGSALLGAAASWITGEVAVSWVYVPIDVAQVLVAGALTWILAARWQRHDTAVRRRST